MLGGGRSDERGSALWGDRRRCSATLVCAVVAAVAVVAGSAAPAGRAASYTAFMTSQLTKAIQANPSALYRVIIKGTKPTTTGSVATNTQSVITTTPATGAAVKLQYSVINGVSALLSGRQISGLSHSPAIASIIEDQKVGETGLSNTQLWPAVAQVDSFWSSSATAPTIAIVDSGIDASRAADFGARVLAQPNLVGAGGNARGDGYGHGTFVASIAAGQADGYSGASPGANIVSLDVLDDTGSGYESDVVNAADWIYKNKDKYGIKVANFSLNAGANSSFLYDPLDQAVEKLWLSGVVVVAAAGNYASNGQPSGVLYAPANDPFVITVGAADSAGTVTPADDFNPPWSAYGSTLDGFAKPELGAPGRYMNGAVSPTAAMYLQHPERIVAPGYMWMSGTSFAAPVVSGAAADVLSLHPTWTPDQVKGALMLTAVPTSLSTGPYALGVGEVQAAAAANVPTPPNPNAGLDQYVTTDASGTPVFDTASWKTAAQADASWNSATWNSASWKTASWNSASWASASWKTASWASASWASGQTTDSTLPAASWASLIWLP
jgi:serine protease AprX